MTGSDDDPGGALGDVAARIVRAAADEVRQTWDAAKADEPDGVHQHRVRVRRLRSILAGLRDVLDPAAARRLRVRFDEWGAELGTVRDLEVLAELARSALEDCGIDDANMSRRLVTDVRAEYQRAHARLLVLADHPRAHERERLLAVFADDPPIVEPAASARSALARTLRREARRVRRAAKGADGTIETLHDLRKAGRRLRYNAEAVLAAAPDLFGDELSELAEAGDALHDALGDHRDALVLGRSLELTRARAGRAGEPVAGYDVLISHVQAGGERALHEVDDAVARARAAAGRLPS
ncbi:CHAD domain-containing protein [Microbacterium sp. Marseille-Q6648]|uniref:CHAD domain-containing protein n=1 Tax=Microbacterium sp. Marseille-Q6648 TaxID=2937991 RepID=UPI002041703F|nr:CHAD domain-containing protein [Microbacterium sp. Marseille-Q6648]